MYESNYKKLFNAITDVINALQNAQRRCEEAFISQGEDPGNAGDESADSAVYEAELKRML